MDFANFLSILNFKFYDFIELDVNQKVNVNI